MRIIVENERVSECNTHNIQYEGLSAPLRLTERFVPAHIG